MLKPHFVSAIEEANGTDNVNEEEKAMLNKHSDADGMFHLLDNNCRI